MLKVADIYNKLNEIAPFDTQLSFDNAGLLVGNMDDNVSKIAIALDATPETVKSAHDNGCDLLITHHPIIFNSIKSLSEIDAAYHAVKLGVCVISAHTNLDASFGGVNDCLCDKIGVVDAKPLSNGEDTVPLARIGTVKAEFATSCNSYAELLKKCIGCGSIKLTQSKANISTVAVCGGAGGDYILAAKYSGADALVTGECKHHERLLAKQIGISLFECGHYCTEYLVKEYLYNQLKTVLDNIIIINENDPAIYI